MIKLLKLRTYERLLLIGFVCFLMLSILVSARSVEIPPQILDLNCYQEKCRTEKDLWDNTNSMCIFTPKISYYKEYFEKNGGGKAVELESFLSKKLGPDEKVVLYVFTRLPSSIHSRQLSIEQKRALLEFQCSQAGLIFGSEDCDEKFIDNFLLLLDKDFLEYDMSSDKKNKIKEIYSSCLVFTGGVPIVSESWGREEFMPSRYFLFLLFVIIGGIILGNWVYHIKEKGSCKRYIIPGILGFFVAILCIFVSLFIFLFLNKLILNVLGYGLPLEVLLLFALGGCVLEFVFYKKTKKLVLGYALIFSMLMVTYVIICVLPQVLR